MMKFLLFNDAKDLVNSCFRPELEKNCDSGQGAESPAFVVNVALSVGVRLISILSMIAQHIM